MKFEGRDIKDTKRSESKQISWTKKFIRCRKEGDR